MSWLFSELWNLKSCYLDSLAQQLLRSVVVRLHCPVLSKVLKLLSDLLEHEYYSNSPLRPWELFEVLLINKYSRSEHAHSVNCSLAYPFVRAGLTTGAGGSSCWAGRAEAMCLMRWFEKQMLLRDENRDWSIFGNWNKMWINLYVVLKKIM